MGFKSRIGRIYGCTKELVKSPFRVTKDVAEGIYRDGVRVKRSGSTAMIVGGLAAMATLPARRFLLPATMAGRAAKNRDTVKGAAVAGFAGGLCGVVLVAYLAELAVILYIVEAMTMAARADERAQLIEARKKKKAGIDIQLEPGEEIDLETGEITVGGQIEVGSLSDSH